MIAFVRGKLVLKAPPILVLDVQGIGYEIEAPMTTFYELPAVGEEVQLHTHLVVREDAHILFGFSTEADRFLFRTLIRVNGVGPKLALVILSGLSADDFRLCIQHNDVQALVRLPGIGKKTAERLVIEMRDRLPAAVNAAGGNIGGTVATADVTATPTQEAISALIALGYKVQDANKMVRSVPAEYASCEDIIRFALQGSVK